MISLPCELFPLLGYTSFFFALPQRSVKMDTGQRHNLEGSVRKRKVKEGEHSPVLAGRLDPVYPALLILPPSLRVDQGTSQSWSC
jgi:hypothetical protein